MINSFKNFERLRYRISNDLKDLLINNKNSNDNMRGEISNTIFATIFSAFVTEVVFNSNLQMIKWGKMVIMLLLFIIIYVISYWLYNFLHLKLLSYLGKRQLQTIDKSMDVMIQIQKDFDNIACDSILAARDFKLAYTKERKNKNIKAFYLFETMHYLTTACEKTKNLVENKEKCIRTSSEAEGVDVFRVQNIINIMQEIDKFLDENLKELDDYTDYLEDIKSQHTYIQELIRKITNCM